MSAASTATTTAGIRHGLVDRHLAYRLPEGEMAQGSTIGAPRTCIICKPTGAVAKIYSSDLGFDLFGAVQLHYWDNESGVRLRKHDGVFHLHPERQDHTFTMSNGVEAHESVFPYNNAWDTTHPVPPPAVYYSATFTNKSDKHVVFDAYAFAELRGNTPADILAEYDTALEGIVAWNASAPNMVRLITFGEKPHGWAVNHDRAATVSSRKPKALSQAFEPGGSEPIGVLEMQVELAPGESRTLTILCVLSPGGRGELAELRAACPDVVTAARATGDYYWSFMERSVVLTPDVNVNHGSLWAKANMLRVQTFAPTGWCFTNDPTRSNNSVGRDTAWYSFGCDYLSPQFARESLRAYFSYQEQSGKIVEYYDVRNGKTADYDLNVNDNTPLMVIALAHHFAVTGDRAFLSEYFPHACRAMDYLLSQCNADGLVWCTSTKTQDWGIVGWRNVIDGYRISGASTEVNSEAVYALACLVTMATELGSADLAARYSTSKASLNAAIEKHLVNPENDLYYLTIDVDGTKRKEITADLVFPVLFEVAPPKRAAKIISVLSDDAFWTDVGIRTIPRDDLAYGPTNGYGLLGGVWVALTYWYAFAAARYDPHFMAHALSKSFHHFSDDPRRNNSVPGQFSEWLHGETLVNQGMMLSPWDAPRYLWATVEGAAGLQPMGDRALIEPHLARDWRWLAAVNVPYQGRDIAWIAVRIPDLTIFTTSSIDTSCATTRYTTDISASVSGADAATVGLGFAGVDKYVFFAGNVTDRTISTAISCTLQQVDKYKARSYSTIVNEWQELDDVDTELLRRGIPIVIDAGGFVLLEFTKR